MYIADSFKGGTLLGRLSLKLSDSLRHPLFLQIPGINGKNKQNYQHNLQTDFLLLHIWSKTRLQYFIVFISTTLV